MTTFHTESRQFSATSAAFNQPHLHLSFTKIFGIRKLRVPGLSCGIVCVILHLAVSVEHRLVADGQTDKRTDRHMMTANTRTN